MPSVNALTKGFKNAKGFSRACPVDSSSHTISGGRWISYYNEICMRKPEYLSPTSINLFHDDPEEYYIRYLSENKPPREPQTQPMSIGSSFDAYVKSFLHERLFGKGVDPRFELKTLFETQVEAHNRDWAWENGAVAFQMYRESGAFADLMLELQGAVNDPKFEIEIRGVINARNMGGVIFLGKPDVYFINKAGFPVILDWKVNGWCSKSPVSPAKGYLRLRHGSKNRSLDKTHHKDAQPMMHQGMMINIGHQLENVDGKWATQLAIYGWLCGMDVGSDFITGLDQLVCKPSGAKYPEVRIAEHRLRIGKEFQWEVFSRAHKIWDCINTGHIFQNLSLKESQQLCISLDAKSKVMVELVNSDNPQDKLFQEMTAKGW